MEDIEHIEKEMKLIGADGRRLDGRRFDELRPIRIEAGVLRRADGSAYIEWGGNKILAAVYRPREAPPRHLPDPARALVQCRDNKAPFTVSDRKRPRPHPRSPPDAKGIPQGRRSPDRGRRAAPDGRPPHVRRVPEGDGPVHRCDEADLRDATRRAPATLLRHPRRHPERVASCGGTGRAGAGAAARGRPRPGGDLMSEEIVSELMRAHVYRLASAGQRVDGRRLDEPRKGSVARSFVKTAEGRARGKLGKTDVLGGIKMSVGEPYPDTPNTGVLATSVELIPMARPTFEAGPPRPDAIELARVVDRGIRESKMVNMEKLCITPKEKVWILFIDIHVLDYDGNLFDACSYGAVAALSSTIAPAKGQG